jgi:hypothetical protein
VLSAGTVFWRNYYLVDGEVSETMSEPSGLRGPTNTFTDNNTASYGE